MTDADVLTGMLHAIDRLDWTTVRDSFTDPGAHGLHLPLGR
jgi:hypothetical protein